MPSKLCPVSHQAHPDVRAFVEAGCPCVRLVDDFGQAEELRALRPDLAVIGRVSEAYDVVVAAWVGTDPEMEARAWVERQSEPYRLNPAIRVWEGPRAPASGSADEPASMRAMQWYAAFEAERLRRLADLDLRGVVGNFGAGAPDLPLWVAFFPALYAAQELQGYLGLHEYSSPWMWWLTGKYQAGNCDGEDYLPGEEDTGWLTLRYRKAYRDYLAPNGLGDLPLVITECGLDSVSPVCPGYTSGPWRTHLDFWQAQDGAHDPIDYWRGPERDAERYYAEQLMWYDREVQQDVWVVGAAIFTVGANAAQQRPFDIASSRIAQFVAQSIRAQREEASSAPVEIAPQVVAVELPPGVQAVPAGDMVSTTPGAETTLAAQPHAAPSGEARAPSPPPDTIFIPPGPGARAEARPGILINASFEEGAAYFADETRELAVPMGWAFSFHDQTAPTLPRQTVPFGRPITALINSLAVAPDDRDRVFAGGVYCWKVSGAAAPVWVRLFQSVESLEPGQRYRLEVNLLPDLVVRTHPQVAYAGDPLSGEFRLEASFDGQSFDSGWKTGRDAPFGHYTRLSLEFAAPRPRTRVALEVRGRWALPMGAWYIDELSLVEA